MKLLARIEKNNIVWLLIGICLFFFFLRLPSLVEPYWYGDEGIYEVIGQSMDHGRLLYRDIWDNKPPLLYVIYALSSGDQVTIKTFSLIVGILTTIAFYFLSQSLFKKQKVSIGITFLFALLFATPLLEANIANAEDFILLPIIFAGLLIYQISTNSIPKRYSLNAIRFIAGLLLGIAFLFKIVAIFDFAAFLLFFIIVNLQSHVVLSFKKHVKNYEFGMRNYKELQQLLSGTFQIVLGFIIPIIISLIYFGANHALTQFLQSAFFDNVDYVGWKNNFFGIPQGWLLLKCIILIVSVFVIIKKRKNLSNPVLFTLLWLVFSVFNAFFSGRPYIHYAIVVIPSFCLFVGLFFLENAYQNKLRIAAVTLLLIIVLTYQFLFNPMRVFEYYQNALQYIRGQKSIDSYQRFFDQKVPRDYEIANFITTHTTASESVFIWGNNPQIYALSQKVPIGKYTVAYHINQKDSFASTQLALNKKNPKYIIVLDETSPLPFVIPLYIMRYNLPGAIIYERSL